MLEREGIKPDCRNSKKEMTHGYDKAFVLVSGGMRPSKKRHMKETHLRQVSVDSVCMVAIQFYP